MATPMLAGQPWFEATAGAAVKGEVYSICSMLELSDWNFYDGLEMKFTSPLGGIQQAGAPKTNEKSVAPCIAFG